MTHILQPWETRPLTSAAMLNPALIAATATWSAVRYEAQSGVGIPWELTFLVAPLVLHEATRRALPRTTRTHLPKWARDNPALVSGLAVRAPRLTSHVREGLRYGLRSQSLALGRDGLLRGRVPDGTKLTPGGEVHEILSTSGLVGAWFAKAGSSIHLFTIFGVKP